MVRTQAAHSGASGRSKDGPAGHADTDAACPATRRCTALLSRGRPALQKTVPYQWVYSCSLPVGLFMFFTSGFIHVLYQWVHSCSLPVGSFMFFTSGFIHVSYQWFQYLVFLCNPGLCCMYIDVLDVAFMYMCACVRACVCVCVCVCARARVCDC